MPVVEKNSWALDIRDAFFNVLDADAYFSAYTRRTNKMLPVQTDLIPYLGVYLVDETMAPDGDPNAGCVRFLHTVRLGFSVVQANNDAYALEHSVDAAWQHILATVLTSASILNVWESGNPEGALIEALTRGVRRHVWGTAQGRNETPLCELEWSLSATYRTEWYPDITDTLNEIDVTASIDNADINVIPPVKVVYDFSGLKRARGKGNGQRVNKS
jgi:hypothetical protein